MFLVKHLSSCELLPSVRLPSLVCHFTFTRTKSQLHKAWRRASLLRTDHRSTPEPHYDTMPAAIPQLPRQLHHLSSECPNHHAAIIELSHQLSYHSLQAPTEDIDFRHYSSQSHLCKSQNRFCFIIVSFYIGENGCVCCEEKLRSFEEKHRNLFHVLPHRSMFVLMLGKCLILDLGELFMLMTTKCSMI